MNRALLCLAVLSVLAAGCRNELDDGVPRLYKCERDGGEACPGGWKCGLDGYCQDPAQHLPYRCEHSSDCEGNWHCGVRGVCYDPNQDTSQPCRIDAGVNEGSDCADGWRCGLESTCHPLDAGAAYQCASDFDCEAQWRCGQERVCVDVNEQALLPSNLSIEVLKVAPSMPADPDAVSFRLAKPFQSPAAVAWVKGNSLTHAVYVTDPNSGLSTRVVTVPISGPVSSLAVQGDSVLFTNSSGLSVVTTTPDGGSISPPISEYANAKLVNDPDSFGPWQDEISAFTTHSVASASLTLSAADVAQAPPGVSIRSLTHLLGLQGSSTLSVLVGTSTGLYLGPRAYGGWRATDGGTSSVPELVPVGLPGVPSECGGAAAIDRVKYFTSNGLLAVTSGGDTQLQIWVMAYPSSANTCDVLDATPAWGPCAPCGSGEQLVDFGPGEQRPSGPWTPPYVDTLCRRADGTIARYANPPSDQDAGACALEAIPISDTAAQGISTVPSSVTADVLDPVGYPASCAGPTCSTLFWRGEPDRVIGSSDQLLAVPPVRSVNNQLVEGDQGLLLPGAGMFVRQASFASLYFAGSIDERPDLAVFSPRSAGSDSTRSLQIGVFDELVGYTFSPNGPSALATLRSSSDIVPNVNPGVGAVGTSEVAHGTQVEDRDGTSWIAIAAGDRVWAGSGDGALSFDGGNPEIQIKVVPLAFGRIQSLTLSAPASQSSPHLLEGYVVDSQRLFRISVPSPTQWLPDEIRLADGVPLKVWTDHGRGRVGVEDGRVFGLPVPVAIGKKLDSKALDFADLCGQGIALTSTGLYRLVSSGGPVGDWVPIPLEATIAGADKLGATWVPPLHVAREGKVDKLFVFNKLGLVAELRAHCAD